MERDGKPSGEGEAVLENKRGQDVKERKVRSDGEMKGKEE